MGIIKDDLIAIDLPDMTKSGPVEITVNGMKHTLNEVTGADMTASLQKVKNFNGLTSGNNPMILYNVNPTCFWYQGKLY